MNVVEVCENSIDNTLEDIADAQRRQMRDGVASDGEAIGVYRSRKYRSLKDTLPSYNPKLGEVDLYQTGSFQRKITANLIGGEIIIESTDSKTQDILNRWGERIFGLSGEYKLSYIRTSLKPSVSREIFQATGLKTNG